MSSRFTDGNQTTANYIAQTNKLREAKEAAEKQQTQLQRSMKDEIERVKTQFLFKVSMIQHLMQALPHARP